MSPHVARGLGIGKRLRHSFHLWRSLGRDWRGVILGFSKRPNLMLLLLLLLLLLGVVVVLDWRRLLFPLRAEPRAALSGRVAVVLLAQELLHDIVALDCRDVNAPKDLVVAVVQKVPFPLPILWVLPGGAVWEGGGFGIGPRRVVVAQAGGGGGSEEGSVRLLRGDELPRQPQPADFALR